MSKCPTHGYSGAENRLQRPCKSPIRGQNRDLSRLDMSWFLVPSKNGHETCPVWTSSTRLRDGTSWPQKPVLPGQVPSKAARRFLLRKCLFFNVLALIRPDSNLQSHRDKSIANLQGADVAGHDTCLQEDAGTDHIADNNRGGHQQTEAANEMVPC